MNLRKLINTDGTCQATQPNTGGKEMREKTLPNKWRVRKQMKKYELSNVFI